MNREQLRSLLESVAGGDMSVERALAQVQDLPFSDLGFAKLDHHRELRHGAPEVIFGEGKTPQDLAKISKTLVEKGQNVLITRIDSSGWEAVSQCLPTAVHHVRARAVTVGVRPIQKLPGRVLVVAAGTTDLPVAEEAVVTATSLGLEVERVYDVGVAGLHRLLRHRFQLSQASVLIVVAGMEGALPSVLGGLCAAPVIAVPTSVGYGASLGGIAALLGMLSSCAPGILVTNIDNGFGAAFAAFRVLQMSERLFSAEGTPDNLESSSGLPLP